MPSRLTSAFPIGTVYGSSGTCAVARGFGVIQPSPMIPLWNMYRTGLSSRIAEIIRPLASYGVEGTTIFMPGRWANVP